MEPNVILKVFFAKLLVEQRTEVKVVQELVTHDPAPIATEVVKLVTAKLSPPVRILVPPNIAELPTACQKHKTGHAAHCMPYMCVSATAAPTAQ